MNTTENELDKADTTEGPIAYHAEAKFGDIEASIMIHRSGSRLLTFSRNTGMTGERYVSFGLHLTADDIVALHALLAGAVSK